ncbi:oxalyl-CoA decarboxylase [Actinoplanes sp. CA-054009]
MTSLDGTRLVVDALKANGVSTVYGVVGIPITDLARVAQASGIRFVGFRHEASAGNAAAAAGFLTGRPGVCLTVSAPGFLNGLVSLAAATTNGFPMIQISGSSERHIIDLEQGDYEEMDQLAVARTLAKAAYRIDRPEDVGVGVARAIRTALSGRPGGVYLDLPAEVLTATTDTASTFEVVDPAPRQLPDPAAVDRAIGLLAGAERPLIVLGKGAAYARADEAIRTFVESTGIPFQPMSMAKGLLPDGHPLSTAAARSLALRRADVVLLLGARLNWLLAHGSSFAAGARLVQVDIDAAEIDSNRPVAAPVVADIGSAVAAFNAAVAAEPFTAPQAWRDELGERKDVNVRKMAARLAADADPMNFSTALGAVNRVLKDHPDVHVVNEGANTLDFGRDILDMARPRHRLDSGTWGVMGIGMGYAIAAAVETGSPVVAVEGDSAFGFSGMDVETICRYRLPVVVLVFNNGGVYQGNDVNSASSDPAPTVLSRDARYDHMIEAFGGAGYHATTPAEVESALRAALSGRTPALINCVIDPAAGTQSGHLTNLNPGA